MRKVASPIKLWIWLDVVTVLVGASVNVGSHTGQAREQIHGILIGILPVLRLIDTASVGLAELRFGTQCHNTNHKLSHWMRPHWQCINGLEYVERNNSAASPAVAQPAHVVVVGHFIH